MRRAAIVILVVALALLALAPVAVADHGGPVHCQNGFGQAWLVFEGNGPSQTVWLKECPPPLEVESSFA